MYDFSMHNYFEIAWKTKEVTEKKKSQKDVEAKEEIVCESFFIHLHP